MYHCPPPPRSAQVHTKPITGSHQQTCQTMLILDYVQQGKRWVWWCQASYRSKLILCHWAKLRLKQGKGWELLHMVLPFQHVRVIAVADSGCDVHHEDKALTRLSHSVEVCTATSHRVGSLTNASAEKALSNYTMPFDRSASCQLFMSTWPSRSLVVFFSRTVCSRPCIA